MRVFRFEVDRGWAAVVGVTALVAAVVAGIVVSPWLMSGIAGGSHDWGTLSDVGQAYGGVSAILSGLALCGIASSLLLQRRQAHLARLTAMRERHFDLVKLGIEDPTLQAPTTYGSPPADIRQWAYINLWVTYWAMLWDTGSVSRPQLRALLLSLFQDEIAFAWWTTCGPLWVTLGGASGAFHALADEAHEHARLSMPRPPEETAKPGEPPR